MNSFSTDTEKYIISARSKVAGLSEKLGRPATACVITFGCQMNARDSEKLAGILESAGYELTDSEDADFVIYNTCTVRENADLRLFGRLGAVGAKKSAAPWKKLAVCGCMMQENANAEKIKKSYRSVDLIFGTHNLFTFPQLLDAVLSEENSGSMIVDIWQGTDRIEEDLPVKRKYSFKSGVNIMFGCDNFCTYCIVPYVRGRERSRGADEIIDEIRMLAGDGVKEIMLLGQNVNSYGKKAAEGTKVCSFPELLKRAADVPGIERVRFMTSHPKDLSDDLIRVIAETPNISRHIHLPLQSGSDRILARMNRGYDRERFLDVAARIKSSIPDAAITTDIIVGFPGETSEDVDQTIDVIERVRFQNAFTFIYSKRNGTPAASFADQADPERVKTDFDRLLKVVQRIAAEETSKLQGTVGEALVEGPDGSREGYVTGRLSNNLLVHFPGDENMIGRMVRVELTEAHGFYFTGSEV